MWGFAIPGHRTRLVAYFGGFLNCTGHHATHRLIHAANLLAARVALTDPNEDGCEHAAQQTREYVSYWTINFLRYINLY